MQTGGILRVGGVLAALFVTTASATAPAKHNVKKATTVQASFDSTWSAVVDVFAERNWSITTLAKDSGLITADWMALSDADAYADCGGSGMAFVEGNQVKFNVRVKGTAPTELSVNALFRQERSLDGRRVFVDCESKGTVERLIHEQVGVRALQAKAVTPAKPAVAAPVAQRGFFCATSTTQAAAGTCEREKAACEAAADAVRGVVADMGQCALAEVAQCFDAAGRERCFPTTEGCAARAGSATCAERK